MKKTYVLDTNVLLTDPSAIFSFEEHDIVLPFTVLEELDKFKTRQDELGANSREVGRQLSVLIKTSKGNLKDGLELPKGGTIRIVSSPTINKSLPVELRPDKNDNIILSVCADIEGSILVTNDFLLRVTADACGIRAEEYKKLSVADSISTMYSGLQEIHVTKEQLADLWHHSHMNNNLTDEIDRIAPGRLPNEFVHVRNGEKSKPFIVRSMDGYVKFVPEEYELPKIKPKNIEQRLALDLLMDAKVNLVTIVGKAGTGKASPIDTPTLTPTGWRPMGEIKPGDFVISVDGAPTKVLATFPQGSKEVYKVTFSDGSSVECCKEHLWETKTSLERDQKKPGKVRTTEELMTTLRYAKSQKKNHSIPMVSPVKFANQPVSIDPYVLGAMLGDGSISQRVATFTTKDPEIAAIINNRINKNGDMLLQISNIEYRIKRIQRNNKPTFLVEQLAKLQLLGKKSDKKFIPDNYKYNNVKVRLELLQGLMDTDGTVSKNGTSITYTSTSNQLAKDVQELVWSFGGKATITKRTTQYTYNGVKKDGKTSYTVNVSLPKKIYPFKLIRKLVKFKPRTKYQPTRYIDTIEPAGTKECVCLLVEHPRHLYITKDYIVTHNTLLALAAGIEQVVEKKKYKSLIVLRPVQPLGKDIGYLPGPVPLYSKVLTPSGFVKMGALKEGMEVIARDGKPAKITKVLPQGSKEILEIDFEDGAKIECCEDHLWSVYKVNSPKRKVLATKILESIQNEMDWNKKWWHRYFIDIPGAVQYEPLKNKLPIHPYILGSILGDGCISAKYANEFSCVDQESIDRINFFLRENTYRLIHKSGQSYNFTMMENVGRKKRTPNELTKAINVLGLRGKTSKSKFIPKNYLMASIEERRQLLQGLMDTDGYVSSDGSDVSYTTISSQLATDIKELVFSLGGMAHCIYNPNKSDSYTVTISFANQDACPFLLSRKAQRWKPRKNRVLRRIKSITRTGRVTEMQCISVAHPEHLYVMDNFVVTHNSKEEKMEPWIAPIKDNLRFLLTSEGGRKSRDSENSLAHYFDRGLIEVEAMTYIRGRSIADAYMIIDEAQNLSAHELKTIITRVGSGTKIVLTGDIEQIDNIYVDSVSNGLAVAVERFKRHGIAGHITLKKGERSELASLAATIL